MDRKFDKRFESAEQVKGNEKTDKVNQVEEKGSQVVFNSRRQKFFGKQNRTSNVVRRW